jgi:hypothetical protein
MLLDLPVLAYVLGVRKMGLNSTSSLLPLTIWGISKPTTNMLPELKRDRPIVARSSSLAFHGASHV